MVWLREHKFLIHSVLGGSLKNLSSLLDFPSELSVEKDNSKLIRYEIKTPVITSSSHHLEFSWTRKWGHQCTHPEKC